MKILITGAGGLVGATIATFLLKKYDIYTTEIFKSKESNKHIVCDLTKSEEINVFEKYNFDIIIHCAAVFPKIFLDGDSKTGIINRTIDDNIIRLAIKINAKVIFISSVNVYGNVGDSLIYESTPLNYNNDYAKNKIISENLLKKELKGNCCCIRLTSPYGPGQKNGNVMKIFMDKAMEGLSLQYYGSGCRTQNFIDVRDIARVIEIIINKNSNGIYNIAGSEEVSMKMLANTVAECSKSILGYKIDVTSTGYPDPQENNRSRVSISKAHKVLGWKPIYSIKEGIENWIRFEKGLK